MNWLNEVSFDEPSLLDFDVLAPVCMHLDIPRLKNASAVNGIESLSYQLC
jgi:hypothetical protein